MAVNCSVLSCSTEASAGVTAMETNSAAVTVRFVEPVTCVAGSVAVMLAWPRLTPVAWPLAPAALLTVATPSAEDFQVTCSVTSAVDWSLNVPVAWNCWSRPLATEGFPGSTSSATSSAAVTVRTVLSVISVPGKVAVMVVWPTFKPVARPAPSATLGTAPRRGTSLVIVATCSSPELQVTSSVRSRVLWSEKVPVAVNC